jgi:Histidine kinase-, DNA gyrase B-, and HSP90-like ATPase
MTDHNISKETPDDWLIDASATKDFFISILVRDIKLLDAIADLVDNCVDGARSIRPATSAPLEESDLPPRFKGLSICLTFSPKEFALEDNCGGISYETARDYAFRFGRAASMPATPGSVGQFGVGMKRALFKIGDHFSVTSTTKESTFVVDVDVNEWKKLRNADGKELWEFTFKELTLGMANADEKCRTKLVVDQLHEAVSEEFALIPFQNRLIATLQAAHEQSIKEGLSISVNGIPIAHNVSTLLSSSDIKPLRVKKTYEVHNSTGQKSTVACTILAGIGDSDLQEAGWSIVCNGRQVLRSDKTSLTGWGDVVSEIKIPKAHYQFSRFRGYVFFEAELASDLPWNTTKTAVDADAAVFKAAKQEMQTAMRQVFDFLNKLDAELNAEQTPLTDAVKAAKAMPLATIKENSVFNYPVTNTAPTTPQPVRVSFICDPDEFAFAKSYFQVSSAKKVGESVFDYFYQRENQ